MLWRERESVCVCLSRYQTPEICVGHNNTQLEAGTSHLCDGSAHSSGCVVNGSNAMAAV